MPLVAVLGLFHYLPEIADGLSRSLRGKQLVLDSRRFDFVLLVAHLLAFIGLSTGVLGNLWASFQAKHRKPEATTSESSDA